MNKINKEESQLIVQSLSSLELSTEIFSNQESKKMFQDMKYAMDNAKDKAEQVRLAKKAVEDGNFLGNWWHDRKDKLKDAQHDLSLAVSELSENNSKLLIFNTAISKMLLDAQYQLNHQQVILNQQAEELRINTEEISEQNEKLYEAQRQIQEQNIELKNLVEEVAIVKGLSQEQVLKIAGLVKNANLLKDELEELFKQEKVNLLQMLERTEISLRDNYHNVSNDIVKINELINGFYLSISNLDEEMKNSKSQHNADIMSVKDMLIGNIREFEIKNKQLQDIINHQKDELLDKIKNQSEEIIEKENIFAERIYLLSNDISSKISRQDYEIQNNYSDLKSTIDDNHEKLLNDSLNMFNQNKSNIQAVKNDCQKSIENVSKDLEVMSNSMEEKNNDIEYELSETQNYFYEQINKLRKMLLMSFVLLLLMVLGLGFYVWSR